MSKHREQKSLFASFSLEKQEVSYPEEKTEISWQFAQPRFFL
jgi:hypothetical protein